MVTRCPLRLQLRSCPSRSSWRGRIRYTPTDRRDEIDEVFHNPSEVEERVRRGY